MMRHVLVSLLMLGVFLLPSCAAAAPKQATVLLVGNYWDGVSDGPLGAAEILVVDGRIAEVGKNVARPEGARVIDLSSKFVTPGFIDAHVHLTGGARFFANTMGSNDASLTLNGVRACGLLLDNGFTTVRDAGDFSFSFWVVPELKKAVESGIIRGPRIVCGGRWLTNSPT